jgi:cytochrome c556
MRPIAILLLASVIQAQAPTAVPKVKPVGTMKELMLDYIFPTSNEIFYVSRNENKTEKDWVDLRANALMLAESANILMSPERAYDNDQWMREAKLLWDVGDKAFKAAKAKDLPALEALNDELYEACQSCHVSYRPGYKRRL